VLKAGIATTTVRRDRLLAALPAGHPLAQRESLTVADLRDEDFVAHAGAGRSVMGSVLSTVCADAGFIPRIRHQVEETSTLVTLVAAGLGVAIVPAPTAALDIAGMSYRRLQPRLLGVDLLAAWLASVENPMIPIVLRVLEM
jgi:DNA-binding transcriptional LysR family regulator